MGLVTGPQTRSPRTHSQWVVGPGRTPGRTRERGWESARPRTPTPRQEAPPLGTLMPPQQHARARAVGSVTGPHARTPRSHSQWVVGPGRTPERTRHRGWESARPRTPHTQATRAPRGLPHAAPTARKTARCGVGDGSPRPHPPHLQPVGSGPRPHARTDERSGVGERPSPDAAHPGKKRPPRAPSCRPHSAQSQLARARVVGLVTGPHARTPRNHSQWVVGPGRTPEQMRGQRWESARPRTPTPRQEAPPPRHPHAAPTARKTARSGVGDGSPRPHRPHPQAVGSGPRPHARTHERFGVGERLSPDAPHPGKRRPPQAPSCRPHSTQERTLWGQ